MDTIKFPLRFAESGEALRLSDGSDEYYAQMLALAMQIMPGELPLAPDYGTEDPTFSTDSKLTFIATAASYVPEVEISEVEIRQDDFGKTRIDVAYSLKQT